MPKIRKQSRKRPEPPDPKPITNWFANLSSREAAATSSREPTLAGILGIDPEVLRDEFDLEPGWRYDPNQRENLVFLSPTVLLADLKIRDGGPKDKGPKEILSRVARDVLDPKQTKLYERHFFFQVPEIPNTHMGYGLTSENKKHKMAITVEEAKLWSGYLDLAKRKTSGEVLHESGTSEKPMEVIYPTPKDTQAFEFEEGDAEELIDPEKSGLKRPVKGSYLLFFSILLMFYQKKLCGKEDSRSEGTQIGPNKISDFHIFWILPYLLNFTHRKVNDIINHHKRTSEEKREPIFKCPIIEKSAMEIIETAFHFSKTPLRISGFIKGKFKAYYGKASDKKYNLPQTQKGTPIILVPGSYQVTDMPVELEDLGSRWRDIGDVTLMDHFMEKFVKSEEIQRDFFASFEHVEKRFGVDYGIILPDLETFSELLDQVERDFPSTFEQVQEQGRGLLSPRLGLVKHSERNRSVCFSYFPGRDAQSVSRMVRLVSSNRLNSFTLVVVYGSCCHAQDSKCKLLSLYPVKGCIKYTFQDSEELFEELKEGVGKFSYLEFPESFKSLKQAIEGDKAVKKMFLENTSLNLSFPMFVRGESLEVGFAKSKDETKLKNHLALCLMAQESYRVRVANLDGCLLSRLSRKSGRVGVVVAINDTLEPYGSLLANLQNAMRRVITHFTRAVVVAGLPEVYPVPPDDAVEDYSGEMDVEDRSSDEEQALGMACLGDSGIIASHTLPGNEDMDDFESDPSEDEDESSEDKPSASGQDPVGYDQEHTDFYASQQPSTSGSGRPQIPHSPEVKQVNFEDSVPSDDVLEDLALKIGNKWKPLGRRLGFEDDAELAQIDQAPGLELSQKALRMLKEWTQRERPNATYKVLYEALSHRFVGRTDLAEDYCTEKK